MKIKGKTPYFIILYVAEPNFSQYEVRSKDRYAGYAEYAEYGMRSNQTPKTLSSSIQKTLSKQLFLTNFFVYSKILLA